MARRLIGVFEVSVVQHPAGVDSDIRPAKFICQFSLLLGCQPALYETHVKQWGNLMQEDERAAVVNLLVLAVEILDLRPLVWERLCAVERDAYRGGEVWLMPENENYTPIDGREAELVGIVKAVIRKL